MILEAKYAVFCEILWESCEWEESNTSSIDADELWEEDKRIWCPVVESEPPRVIELRLRENWEELILREGDAGVTIARVIGKLREEKRVSSLLFEEGRGLW